MLSSSKQNEENLEIIIEKISKLIKEKKNIFDSIDELLKEILTCFNATTGSISLVNKKDKNLIIYSAVGIEKEKKIAAKLPFGIGLTGTAATLQKTIYSPDVLKDPRYVKLIDSVVSELAVPILFSKELIGILNLESNQKNSFDKKDISRADKLSKYLGKSLSSNIHYFQALEKDKKENDDVNSILGYDAQIIFLKNRIRTVAPSDASLLLLGESGTGKELIAKSLHLLSTRKDKPFVTLNCGSLNENLLESEMFGHVKGAFTGADRNVVGRFEAADGGTLFLDEIAEMPIGLQIKLLRVLQEGEIERVGDYKKIKVNVRIISATHKDIPLEVEKGNFRNDLYFRIAVIPIRIPPLRERRGDIALLAHHFLLNFNRRYGKNKFFDSETIEILSRYSWSGNVRELENVVQYSAIISTEDQISPDVLPESVVIGKRADSLNLNDSKEINFNLEKAILELEFKILKEAFIKVKSQDKVASLVGISRGALQYKIKNNLELKNFLIKNNQ